MTQPPAIQDVLRMLPPDVRQVAQKYMELKSHGFGELHAVVVDGEGKFVNILQKNKILS